MDGAQVLASFRFNRPAASDESHPAILTAEFGKGRVVYFAAAIDKGMFFYPDRYMRHMLANAVRWAAHDVPPPVEVQGPLILATNVRRQAAANRVVVHLLNDHSSYGRHSVSQQFGFLPPDVRAKHGVPDPSELRGNWPVREEVIPLRDIKIRC